MDVARKGVQGC